MDKSAMLPAVTLICLDCTEQEIEEKRNRISYENVVIKSASVKTGLKEVFGIILALEDSYICFGEAGRVSDADKIEKMVAFLENTQNADCVLCRNEYVEENGTHIAWMPKLWMGEIAKSGDILNGTRFLRNCLLLEENLYGNLECCMFRREVFINKDFLLNYIDCTEEEAKMMLMFECLFGMRVGQIKQNFVKSVEKTLDEKDICEKYKNYINLRSRILSKVYQISGYKTRELPLFYRENEEKKDQRMLIGDVKKEITFFHMGKTEYFNLEPIAREAERRGYKVKFTENLSEEAEIGIYCSHIGCIQRAGWKAKFSVILLHDMTQGELDWPDLWNDEPWNQFDLGILPGKGWTKRWQGSSGFYYAHPKFGVYEVGYPKGDSVGSEELNRNSEQLKETLGLKHKYTILYAPSWENNDKEDDFVKALKDLPVNLLIKQGAYIDYPHIALNAIRMRILHDGEYENLKYIDPLQNIMEVYPFCDIVVSEESGTLTESLLFGKTSIAVTDWLIPDEDPPRPAAVPFDYVYKCEKAQLKEKVQEVLAEIEAGTVKKERDNVFSHIGDTCPTIVDLLDYFVGKENADECLKTEIEPIYSLHGLWD